MAAVIIYTVQWRFIRAIGGRDRVELEGKEEERGEGGEGKTQHPACTLSHGN